MAKWCFLPYDFDTGIGTNNEGALAFSYELEDIDKLAGADVFNGQNSVLWKNLRQAYFDKIKQMYQELRSQGKLSYDDTERRFEDHQAVWSEAIFNEDSYFKYLAPLIDDNTSAYLSMLQGSKAEQRKWWLYNRFRYIDSKYNAGDALTDVITVRGYAKSDITVTPYADIYASVKYGSYLTQMRALRGNSYTLKCPLDNVNDTEIYIYSASQLKDIGDLSGLKIGYAEFSLATKLQAIKVGAADESYANPNLTELHLGNNTLLRKLDVRNCPNLTQTVDISGCYNVEFVYFDGTSVAGILLPSAGILKELHLPATITNLTIRNQPSLYDLTVPDYSKITTLRLENVNKVVDSKTILKAIPANSRVRLLGIDWTAEDADDLMNLIALLDTMRGLDENGNNLDTAQVSGTISVDTVTGAQVAEIQSKYPDIKIAYQHITSFLYFYNDTGTTLLYTQSITDGADGAYSGSTPSKSSTAQYTYSFAGWSKKLGGNADSTALKAVVADRNVYAAFTATIRKYTVYFYNGNTLLQTVKNVPYGSNATYTGTTPVSPDGSAEDYPFEGFEPNGKNITGNVSCYAQFGSPIFIEEIIDSWETIIDNIANNLHTQKYKIGNYKMLSVNGVGDIIMFISDFDENYVQNNYDTKKCISFVSGIIKSENTTIFKEIGYKLDSSYAEKNSYTPSPYVSAFDIFFNNIEDDTVKNHILNMRHFSNMLDGATIVNETKIDFLSCAELGLKSYIQPSVKSYTHKIFSNVKKGYPLLYLNDKAELTFAEFVLHDNYEKFDQQDDGRYKHTYGYYSLRSFKTSASVSANGLVAGNGIQCPKNLVITFSLGVNK